MSLVSLFDASDDGEGNVLDLFGRWYGLNHLIVVFW